MDNIMTEWQIKKNVDKINFNNNIIRKVLNHEQKVCSKGKETLFRRNDDKSEEVGRKYRIMTVLQAEETKLLENKNASLLTRTQTNELCQNLTAGFAMPMCLPSNCKSSDLYRSIDGCCNNLEFPTQGIS